jgi:DNA-binding NtrC family response regulator
MLREQDEMIEAINGREAPPTILVVEDEPLLRLALQEVLSDAGFTVMEADCVARAVELVMSPQSDIDLVFTDIRMPGAMNGMQLADWIRERQPGVPVLLTSGYSDKGVLQKYPFMAKPYDFGAVVEKIRALLRESTAH